jgi:hypothetical protein
MAYFAKLGIGNKVLTVHSVEDSIATTEQAGIDFLNNLYKTDNVWKQTYIDGSQRKNYAGIGFKYDTGRDAFIPIKPFSSWVLNESTCKWDAPVAKPESESGATYEWNESTKSWDEIIK